MRSILFLALCMAGSSCFTSHEIQAELVDATLVKVEEVNRYPNIRQKVFTWQTDKAVSFVTFESAFVNIPLGTHTKVLLQR